MHQLFFAAVLLSVVVFCLSCAVVDPNQTLTDAHRLDYCRIELDQKLLRQVELPELAQDMHPLLGPS